MVTNKKRGSEFVRRASVEKMSPQLDRKIPRIKMLKQLMGDEKFLYEQKQIKQAISVGNTLDEALDKAEIFTEYRRNMHLQALSIFSTTPEIMMLHYRERSKVRYQMFLDLYMRAKEARDRKVEFQVILALAKLDASEVELAQALGLIAPPNINEEHSPQNTEELKRELQRIEDEIRSRIEDLRSAAKPIALDIQPRPFIGKGKDSVDEVPVPEDPA